MGYNRSNPFSDNPDIVLHRVQTQSLEWHKERSKGVGASEVPIILGKAKWENTNVWKLWQEKVGLVESDFKMTERMMHGMHMEDRIAEMWKYWKPNAEWYLDFIRNYMNTEKVEPQRQLFRLNAIVRNKNYPWLSANLDRVAPAGQYMADFITTAESNYLVEIKNIDSMVARHYEDDIPAYYHSQAQTQMMVTGTNYYEFAVFLSGNRLEVKGYYPDANLMSEIVDKTHDFWYNNVLPAREANQRANEYKDKGDFKGYDDIITEIYGKYEPEMRDDEQYHEYVRERFKHEYSLSEKISYVMSGDKEIFDLAQRQALFSAISGVMDKESLKLKVQLEYILRENNVKVIEFDKGKITWFPNKGSDKPTFRNNVLNVKALDEDRVQELINQINTKLIS